MISKRALFASISLGLAVFAVQAHVQVAGQADPRQRKIVFDSRREGHREIYVMDPNGSNEQQLTRSASSNSCCPSWSPDRKRIAFE